MTTTKTAGTVVTTGSVPVTMSAIEEMKTALTTALAQAPIYPGTATQSEVHAGEAGNLGTDGGTVGDTHVTITRTGIVPVGYQTADRWYRAHLTVTSSGSLTGCNTPPTESLDADIGGEAIEIGLTALTADSTSVVTTARASVVPSRPASSNLPIDVTGAKVLYSNMNHKDLNFTKALSVNQAQTMVAAINLLSMDTGALHGCPMIDSTLTVLFHTPDGDREVQDTRCGEVTVGSTVLVGQLDSELLGLGVQIPTG